MLRHRFAVILSGLIWMGVGIFLLYKGLNYLILSEQMIFNHSHTGFSLISLMSTMTGSPGKGFLVLLCCGLVLGFIKGRFILKKTVHRIVNRICNLPSPFLIHQLYPKGYYIILIFMVVMGISFKFLPLPLDIKGFVDFTVGIALLNGAMLYFRAALFIEKI